MLSVAVPAHRLTPRDSPRDTPRTKICGVTTADDAVAALDLGADLLGLNFYPPSPRFLTPERAGELIDAVRRQRPDADLLWAGVFVGEPAERLVEIAATARLDLVQLHGDEEPDHFDGLPDGRRELAAKTIKVFRVRGTVDAEDMHRRMEPWRALGVWGFLVDTRHPDLYGGTGESWDMSSIADLAADLAADLSTGGPRLLLAGGLGPDTVRAALGACRPWGVDLCSGVESEPGRKDPHLMRRLFEEIRHGTTRPAT